MHKSRCNAFLVSRGRLSMGHLPPLFYIIYDRGGRQLLRMGGGVNCFLRMGGGSIVF